MIEIDVISARGQLVAGRDQPWSWLARRLFRGPTLAEAWDRAAAGDIVKLDLKQTDHGFLDDLVDFLAPRAKSRRVMISSDGKNRCSRSALRLVTGMSGSQRLGSRQEGGAEKHGVLQ